MASNTKAHHSNRFILSSSGLAFIALVLAIATQGSNADISGPNRAEPTPVKYTRHASAHTLFPTGDVDFDYAADMRMHHQIAVGMSQAQIRNGKHKALHIMAMRIIAEHRDEIAKLDRWMAVHTDGKARTLASSR
jgi:hypothetical protein